MSPVLWFPGQLSFSVFLYYLPKSDSLWLQFAQAMEQKDISYLNQHSLDSIECAECNCAKTDNDFLNANFAFTHCLDKLMHLERLTDKEFVTTENGSDELQVIYSVKAPMAEEGAYNLIFQFERKGKTYFFKGMLVT